MAEWTRDMVEERVEEAADVLRQLPPVRLSGYFSTWPDILRSFGDRVGANPVPMRRPPPNPAAISRMEETITWNRFLERDEVAPDVGAGRGHAVEAPLLPLRHQPAHGAPAVRLRAQRHRLAAERAAGASSARAEVRRRAG